MMYPASSKETNLTTHNYHIRISDSNNLMYAMEISNFDE